MDMMPQLVCSTGKTSIGAPAKRKTEWKPKQKNGIQPKKTRDEETQGTAESVESQTPSANALLQSAMVESDRTQSQLGTATNNDLQNRSHLQEITGEPMHIGSTKEPRADALPKLSKFKKWKMHKTREKEKFKADSTPRWPDAHNDARVKEEIRVGCKAGSRSLASSLIKDEIRTVPKDCQSQALNDGIVSQDNGPQPIGGFCNKRNKNEGKKRRKAQQKTRLTVTIDNSPANPIVESLAPAAVESGPSATAASHMVSLSASLDSCRVLQTSEAARLLAGSESQQHNGGSTSNLPRDAKPQAKAKSLQYIPSHPNTSEQHISISSRDVSLSAQLLTVSYRSPLELLERGDHSLLHTVSRRRASIAEIQDLTPTPNHTTSDRRKRSLSMPGVISQPNGTAGGFDFNIAYAAKVEEMNSSFRYRSAKVAVISPSTDHISPHRDVTVNAYAPSQIRLLLSKDTFASLHRTDPTVTMATVELASNHDEVKTLKVTPSNSQDGESEAYVREREVATNNAVIAAATITHVNESYGNTAEAENLPIAAATTSQVDSSDDNSVQAADLPITVLKPVEMTKSGTIVALGENLAARNKTVKARPETEKYLPPHLRALTQTASVATVRPVSDAELEKNVKLSEAVSSEPKLAPHLRALTQPAPNMQAQPAADGSKKVKSVKLSVSNESNLAQKLCALVEHANVEIQSVGDKPGTKDMKVSISTEPILAIDKHTTHYSDGVHTGTASSVLSQQQIPLWEAKSVKKEGNTIQTAAHATSTPGATVSGPSKVTNQSYDMSAGNSPSQTGTPQVPTKRSPEEVFVPRTPKSKTTPTKLVTIQDLLPAHLRNLPKPILMGPQVKRNAERAAQQALLDIKTDVQHVIIRNEESYLPTVDLTATKQLLQELATDEETPAADVIVAKDGSSVCPEISNHLSVDSGLETSKQGKVWRWFNNKEPSESGKTEYTPKKELRHELADWDGNWQTAPIEWDLRGQFDNSTRTHVRWMENWVLDRVMELLNMPFKVDTSDQGWISGQTPASGTRKQWQTYPEECLWDRVPLEYGAVDWDATPVLRPQDPFSNTDERREQTSLSTAKKFRIEQNAEKKKHAEDRFSRRVEHEAMKRASAQLLAEIAPKANIYIQPAQLSHVLQIKDIYNHYVKATVHAPELDPTTEVEWQNRLADADDSKLAFLVAVLKSAKRNGPGARQGRAGRRDNRRAGGNADIDGNGSIFQDNIVGFAYAEDHAGARTMFERAVELQVFVHPGHLRLGIGKTLMDRMMSTMDRVYCGLNATEFLNNDGKLNYDAGGSRVVYKILMNVAFHIADENEFEWRKKWLERTFDFDHIGTMVCMGKKFDKGVNIAYMVKETSQAFGVSYWFSEQPYRIPHRERLIKAQQEEEARLANGKK